MSDFVRNCVELSVAESSGLRVLSATNFQSADPEDEGVSMRTGSAVLMLCLLPCLEHNELAAWDGVDLPSAAERLQTQDAAAGRDRQSADSRGQTAPPAVRTRRDRNWLEQETKELDDESASILREYDEIVADSAKHQAANDARNRAVDGYNQSRCGNGTPLGRSEYDACLTQREKLQNELERLRKWKADGEARYQKLKERAAEWVRRRDDLLSAAKDFVERAGPGSTDSFVAELKRGIEAIEAAIRSEQAASPQQTASATPQQTASASRPPCPFGLGCSERPVVVSDPDSTSPPHVSPPPSVAPLPVPSQRRGQAQNPAQTIATALMQMPGLLEQVRPSSQSAAARPPSNFSLLPAAAAPTLPADGNIPSLTVPGAVRPRSAPPPPPLLGSFVPRHLVEWLKRYSNVEVGQWTCDVAW